jgi:membrane-associated phospholipid phosphatase
MSPWHAITAFGDSAMLLPLVVWTGLCLVMPPRRVRDARRWVVAVGVAGGIVCLSKLLFMGWGVGPADLDYTGFSGHTTLALLVWPSLAALLARDAEPVVRRGAIALATGLGAAVAVSRLVLKVHSPSEVALGAVLGIAVMAWFVRGLAPAGDIPVPRHRRAALLLGLGTLAIVVACHGRVFPSQHILKDIAQWLSGHGDVFTRRPRQDSP